ncbi:MAG: glycosyltransferase family 39 protein, partial [bacterium]
IIYKQYGINHVYARMVSIFFSSLGLTFLYLLIRELLGKSYAVIAALFFTFNAYNIFYSRVVLPDPMFVALSTVSLYWCVKWVKSKQALYGILLGVTFAIAILVKPYALFIGIPMLYWVFINWGFKKTVFKPFNYLVLALALIPFILWRTHIAAYPEGSFTTTWLYNAGNIRFKGAWFRWIFYDRLNRLIFGTGGFVLFFFGFIRSHITKNRSLFFVWTLAIFLYFTIFAKGNVNHDYYQLPVIPVGSALVAIGFIDLIKLGKNRLQKTINFSIASFLFLLALAFSWYEVRGFFNINNEAMVKAGQAINELTPPDALVIAPYQVDPAFLYQTNRHGWPVGGDIDTKIKAGAKYYVTTSFDDEFAELKNRFGVMVQNNDYAIIELGLPK